VGNPQDAVFVRQQVRNLTDAGLSCQLLAFRYCPRGVPAAVWRLRYARHLQSRDTEAGFPVHDVFVSRSVRNADVIPRVGKSLIQYIERHPALLQTDVIYGHWLWPGGAAALQLRNRFGWPVVAIARGSEMHHWQTVHRHCRPYVERVLRESDVALANCAALRDEGYWLVPRLTRPIGVLYNGCDAQRFAPVPDGADRDAVRRMLGLDSQARLMLFCGSVIERKGIRNLASAWERFHAQYSDWQLVVVGRLVDPELVRLLMRAGRVTLAGPVQHHEVISYMRAADVYVQPSVHEGLANATMEAMAAGLPVIVTDTGGQGELVTDGVNGLLIPIEDPAAPCRAFARMADDRNEAERMGWCARETIVSRFSYRAQIDGLVALLADAATKRRIGMSSDVGGRAPQAVRISAASR